jgi:hypothetical protein
MQLWKGEMTRQQALAVAWEALAVLAMNGQARFYDDKKNKRALIAIANTRIEVVPTPEGKRKIKLVDLEQEPTQSANTGASVGDGE